MTQLKRECIPQYVFRYLNVEGREDKTKVRSLPSAPSLHTYQEKSPSFWAHSDFADAR